MPNTVPIGTYFIRAFVLKNSTIKGKPQAQVAFGTSKGFFEVSLQSFTSNFTKNIAELNIL